MLDYVTLYLDAFYATGQSLQSGQAYVAPNTTLTAVSDQEWIPQAPVTVPLYVPGGGNAAVSLVATDSADITPAGWAYSASFSGVPGTPSAMSFYLPAGPVAFTATDGTPCVFSTAGTYSTGSGVTLSGSGLPGGFGSASTYYVVSQSGTTFSLASALNGSPLASTSAGSGSVTTVSTFLSSVTPLYTAPSVVSYLPLPSGVAVSGDAPVASGAGNASTWTAVLVNPMTTLGDTLYENATPVAARLAGNTTATKNFLTQTGTGSESAAPAWGTIAASDIPLDSTASDIAAVGTALAAGSTGKPADAGHVHVDQGPGAMPADQAMIAWNMDPALVSQSNTITAGVVYFHAIFVRTAQTITNLIWCLGTVTGWTCTTNECFMALFNSAGTQVGITADQSSNWNSAGLKVTAMTSPYDAPAGKYYLAILMNGTGTTFTARGGVGSVAMANCGAASPGASLRFSAYATTGQTAMPGTITPADNVVANALTTAVMLS